MHTEPRRRALPSGRAMIGAVVAATCLAWLAGCSPKTDTSAQTAPPVAREVTLTADQQQHLRLYTVSTAGFRRTIDTTGVVDFDNDQATSVLAPFSGPVTRLLVEAGDKVKKGQPLAEVESPDFAAAIGTYAKALAIAQTNRKLADIDKDLLQHNGISVREEQQAQTDAVGAEADRDAALQTLRSLDVYAGAIASIEHGRPVSRVQAVIRSPIAGTVAEKLITPGQLLAAGTTPAFTIADLSRVWVLAQLSASEQGAVGVGDTATIETGVGAHSLPGTVANISAEVNPDTRAVTARVAAANPGGVLKKQMYVRVRIQARAESTGVLVPVSAILRDDENLPFVYAAQPAGAYARRPVTLGDRVGDQFNILSGLQGGERIVVDGGLFVQFMQNQ